MKRCIQMVPNNAVAAAYPPPLVEVGRPPVAFAVKVIPMSKGRRWVRGSRSRGQVAAWLVEVECPYGCKSKIHIHGAPGPELLEFVGHRGSHCGVKSANDRGYYVVVPSSLVASAVAAVES